MTYSLRRRCVYLAGREHRVIDVRGAAAKAPWLRPGAHMGHTMQASRPDGCPRHGADWLSRSSVDSMGPA